VASAASPQSIGSDLSIVAHNDLYGISTPRRAGTIALSTRYIYSAATSKCAALGSILWNPDSYSQDLDFLRYLDHGKATDDVGVYWIRGNTTLHCRAITTRGEQRRYPCSTQLPVLCSNTATDETRQVAVIANNATILGRRRRQDSSFRFLGIKYASIPARFSHSTYLAPAPGSNISALEYAPSCVQPACGSSGTPSCDEDCLHLNIWTPYLPNGKQTTDKRKAVIVWIHGGGFTSGTGSDTTFDGSALASRGDVVVVTINYRLSTLGFLALDNTPLTGNYGLQDQNRALDWLRAHVGDFGGDKDRITIFGQSAGAASVRALLASPQVRGKVSGAIMMSTPQGVGYASTFSQYLTIAEATTQTEALVAEVGCANLKNDELVACLRALDPKHELEASAQPTVANTFPRFPVIDGTFLSTPSLPLGPSAPKLNVNVISGIMRDDGSPFTSYPTSSNVSQVLTSQGFPASAILSSNAFPIYSNLNSTLAIFNLTSRVATDAMFRCLGQSTAYSAAANGVFNSVYAYEFDRAYQISEWSPNPPSCEAPATPSHPLGDPSAPFYKCHSGELYAVFGTTIPQGRQPRDQLDIPFSQYVVDTWSAFARTGNPNPDLAYLTARGFTNTTRIVKAAGSWEPLGKGGKKVRVLDLPVRDEGWREVEQCKVLGQGLEYYN
ncbi:Alpha/Beta hydrolase protein, partial [Pyrenochaeta sp. MPI-SDFR-AT-0127]